MRLRKLTQLTLLLILTSFFIDALAVGPGFYIGLMFGPASSNAKPELIQIEREPPFTPIPISQITVIGKPRSNQYGTRFFLGYKMNPYFGLESGFTFFTTVNYKIDNPLTNPRNLESCSSSNIRVGVWDFLGRLSLPFGDWFEFYAKAGAGAAYVKLSGDLTPDGTRDCGRSSESARIRGVGAIGANMSLSQNWVVDASWTRYLLGNIVGYMDLYAIGVAYHFVDRYCGQFLCDD